MNKIKFWMIQIALVTVVSLIFGAPVLADDDDHDKDGKRWHQKWKHHNDDDDAFKDEKWHSKWTEKQTKKEAWHKKKLGKIRAKYDGQKLQEKETNLNEKISKWESRYKAKEDRHNAKYHASEPTDIPEPDPVCPPGTVGTWPDCF